MTSRAAGEFEVGPRDIWTACDPALVTTHAFWVLLAQSPEKRRAWQLDVKGKGKCGSFMRRLYPKEKGRKWDDWKTFLRSDKPRDGRLFAMRLKRIGSKCCEGDQTWIVYVVDPYNNREELPRPALHSDLDDDRRFVQDPEGEALVLRYYQEHFVDAPVHEFVADIDFKLDTVRIPTGMSHYDSFYFVRYEHPEDGQFDDAATYRGPWRDLDKTTRRIVCEFIRDANSPAQTAASFVATQFIDFTSAGRTQQRRMRGGARDSHAARRVPEYAEQAPDRQVRGSRECASLLRRR
jgi:hypothetical protein